MKVIDNTLQRLSFSMGIPYFFSTDCVFDRASGIATIARRFFFIPMPVRQIRLGDIDKAMLMQPAPDADDRANRRQPDPYAVLVLRDGTQLQLASVKGQASTWATTAINTFLQAKV